MSVILSISVHLHRPDSLLQTNEGLLFRSYLPCHLRERSIFRDRHDLPTSGGHLVFEAKFDTMRDRFWWPTIPTDVRTHVDVCLSCQHRKSSHRPIKLPVGHRPVPRAFQYLAVDLVECKCLSQGYRFILSVIDHLTRFVILIAIEDKAARTIDRHLIERVLSVCGLPETPHPDQGTEFENQLVKELQSVLGYKKTRTAAFRPQGNSVLERAHSTISYVQQHVFRYLGRAVTFCPVSSQHSLLNNDPANSSFLKFGRSDVLHVDLIHGVPPTSCLLYTSDAADE